MKYAFKVRYHKMAKEFVMPSSSSSSTAIASSRARAQECQTLEEKLGEDQFDEDQHIKTIADRLNDDVLSEFQRERMEIQQLADKTSQQLKQNVYKNYTRWVAYRKCGN